MATRPNKPLPEREYEIIRALRKMGALESIEGARLPKTHEWIAFMCGDGHRFNDAFVHKTDFLRRQGICADRGLCFHAIALNGGSLLLDPNYQHAPACDKPGCCANAGDLVIGQIQGAITLKRLANPAVALFGHTTCAMAEVASMSVEETYVSYIRGRERVRAHGLRNATGDMIPTENIFCVVQVDYQGHRNEEDRRFRSYVLRRNPLIEWCSRERPDLTERIPVPGSRFACEAA